MIFELRKQPRDFLDTGRLERSRHGRRGGVRRGALLEQAGRAKAGEGAGGQRRAALRTFLFHILVCFRFIHTPCY